MDDVVCVQMSLFQSIAAKDTEKTCINEEEKDCMTARYVVT